MDPFWCIDNRHGRSVKYFYHTACWVKVNSQRNSVKTYVDPGGGVSKWRNFLNLKSYLAESGGIMSKLVIYSNIVVLYIKRCARSHWWSSKNPFCKVLKNTEVMAKKRLKKLSPDTIRVELVNKLEDSNVGSSRERFYLR